MYSMQLTELTICGMKVNNRKGKIQVSVRKMKVLTVKMKTMTLIGTNRWNGTCHVY